MEFYSVERVLGEGRLAVPHGSRRARWTCRIIRWRGYYLSRASSTAARAIRPQGQLPAIPQSARLGAGAARAVGRAGPMVDARQRAAAKSEIPKLSRRNAGAAAAAGRGGLPEHSRRHVHRIQDDALSLELRAELLRDRHPDDQPAGRSRAVQDNPANGPIYPSFVPKTDKDGNEIAGIRLPELTVPLATYTGWALRSGLGERRLRRFGAVHPVREDQGGAPRIGRSAPRWRSAIRRPWTSTRRRSTRGIDNLVKDRLLLCEDPGPCRRG